MTIIEILQIILYACTIAVYCLLVYLLIYMNHQNKKENKKENEELVCARKQIEILIKQKVGQDGDITSLENIVKKLTRERTELENECNKKEEQINKLKVRLYDKEHNR